MSPQKSTSFQDLFKEQQKEESREAFFGRGDEIARFREVLAQPTEDRRLLFFNAYGQGGVGKSFLLKRFQQIAHEHKVLTAWSNDGQRSIIDVMAQLSEDLRAQGARLKSFEDRLKTYREKRSELEADPELPASFLEFLGQTATRAGLWAGAQAAGATLLLPFIKADDLAAKVGEALAFVARKVKKDDVQLVQDPIAVLTPLWLNELREACERRTIVLFFDAYEHTAEHLDEWLRDILHGDYGKTTLNLLLAIAGQVALPWDAWSDYERFISRMPLDSFTLEETRVFLRKKGLIEEQAVTDIFRKTRGLPVLVALLAAVRPGTRMTIDPHETAIEHFLKGVEPRQRQVALDAALPRLLNRDVLAELIGAELAEALFGWLKRMPFVQLRPGGWEYHPVVRHLMMAYKHQESPEGWSKLHRRLGDYAERLQKQLELPEARQFQDAVWREHALTIIYHRVCENSHRALGMALNGFLTALKFQRAFARQWAELLQQAEEDADSPEALRWGARLIEALKAIEGGKPSEAIEAFTALLARDELEKKQRAVALNWRGYLYRNNRQPEQALEDLSAAIELAPEDDEYLADRARLLFLLKHHSDALVDLDRAIALKPDASKNFFMRIMVLVALDRDAEAEGDVAEAMRLDPQSPARIFYQVIVAMRRRDTSQLTEAIAELSRLMPQFVDTINEAYAAQSPETTFSEITSLVSHMGLPVDLESPSAQQQKTVLLQLIQGNSAPWINAVQVGAAALKALSHRQKGELEEAIAAINQAIQLAPSEVDHLLTRAELLAQMGRPEDALAEFDQIAALKPQSAEVFSRRGSLLLSLGRSSLAFADYSRAIELEPSATRFLMRSYTQRQEGHYPEALSDLERAIELQPGNLLQMFHRLPLQILMNNMEGAVEAYAQLAAQAPLLVQQLKSAIAGSDPEQHRTNVERWLTSTDFALAGPPYGAKRWIQIARMTVEAGSGAVQADAASFKASVHRHKEEFLEALAAVNQALALDPDHAPHLLERAKTYHRLGLIKDALSDLGKARTLEPDSAHLQLSCAKLYWKMDRLEEGLATIDQVLALAPEMTMVRVMRGVTLAKAGRYAEALEDISRTLEQTPDLPPALYVRGTLYLIQERYTDALADLEAVAARDSTLIKDWLNMRGELLARLGRYDEALEVYQQVLAKDPENWSAAYNLAVTRAWLEGPAAVGDALADVLGRLQSVLTTNRADALARLGGIEALTESADRAFELLTEAASLDRHIIHWAKGDPAWSRLRNDPRFQALLNP